MVTFNHNPIGGNNYCAKFCKNILNDFVYHTSHQIKMLGSKNTDLLIIYAHKAMKSLSFIFLTSFQQLLQNVETKIWNIVPVHCRSSEGTSQYPMIVGFIIIYKSFELRQVYFLPLRIGHFETVFQSLNVSHEFSKL